MRSIRLIILVLILTFNTLGQAILISKEDKVCYIVDNLQVGTMIEQVESVLGKKLNIKKDFETIYLDNKTLFFYKGILWRIEKQYNKSEIVLPDSVHWHDDIKIVIENNKMAITDIYIWRTLVNNNKVGRK